MPRKPPVLLFTFANQRDEHLPLLQEEERHIRTHFNGLHDRRRLELHVLGASRLDDIYRELNRFHNRIALFHYGGHSGSQELFLEDAPTRATNLAKVLSMHDQLHLVVLNGCSNRAQATILLDAGVKVVIGTACQVQDDQAVLFAKQLYDSLAQGRNIQSAFDAAMAYIADKQGKDHIDVVRGPVLRGQKEQVPWALYYREEKHLQWVIPSEEADAAPQNEAVFREDISVPHRRVNQSLINQIAEGLRHFFPQLGGLLRQYQKTKNEALFYDLKDEVLDRFPSVISSHIAALFNPRAKPLSRQRLRKLYDVYMALGQYLCSIALSNLWDAALDEDFQPRADFRIQEEYWQDLSQFFGLNERSAAHFDYLWLLTTIHFILQDNQLKPFVKELGELVHKLINDKACFGAYRFLEQELRQPMASGRIHRDEIGTLCLNAERQLGKLLADCAFLSTYELATVREIRVRKGKREALASFVHQNAVLRGTREKHNSIISLDLENYTEDRSIILSKSLSAGEAKLNLSPFLLDLNAFSIHKEDLPDIYFWLGSDDQGRLCLQRAEQMTDYFYVERETEDDLLEPSALSFSMKYDDMNILFQLVNDLKKDLKVL